VIDASHLQRRLQQASRLLACSCFSAMLWHGAALVHDAALTSLQAEHGRLSAARSVLIIGGGIVGVELAGEVSAPTWRAALTQHTCAGECDACRRYKGFQAAVTTSASFVVSRRLMVQVPTLGHS
jgi:hypothetical protein